MKDLQGTRLFAILDERRVSDYAEHDAECETCWAYARTCLECGMDLTAAPHKFRCVHNPKRWRKLFAKRAPPLAHEARHRPTPIETPPPPRRAVLEVAPARGPTAKAKAPPPAGTKPQGAPSPASKPATASAPKAAPPPAKPRLAPKPSPFEVLGLKPDATVSEIRAAYRDKAMEYHPDRVASLAPDFQKLAEQRMRAINEAYEALLRMAAKPR